MIKNKRTEKIRAEKNRWIQNVLRPNLKLLPERLPVFTTVSNLLIDELLYAPSDISVLDYLKDIGFPGEYPFTRGTYPSMYRGRIWTMREFAGYGTAEETNKRFKYLLKKGRQV